MGAKGEEKIAYVVSQEGAEKTASEVDKVADAFTRSAKSQTAFARSSENATALGRLAAYRAEADRVSDVVSKSGVAIGKMTKAANDNAASFGNMGRQVSEVGTQLGHLFSRVTGLNQFQTAIDVAARSAVGFASNLVGGVGVLGTAGVVAGGVIGAVGALGLTMHLVAAQADELAAKTLKNAQALGTYANQIDKLRSGKASALTAASGSHDLQEKLDAGRGSVREYETERAALKDLVAGNKPAELEKNIQGAYQAGDRETVVKLQELKKALAEAPARIEKYRQFEKEARSEAAAAVAVSKGKSAMQDELFLLGHEDKAKAEKKPPSFDEYAAEEKNLANIHKLKELEAKNDMRMRADDWAQEDAYRNASLKAEMEAEKEKRRVYWETYDEKKKADQKAYEAGDRMATESARSRLAVEQMFGRTAANITAQLISAAISGKKIEVAALLSSIGNQMIAQGTMAIFEGTIRGYSSYGFDATAYGLISTGGLELAAGVALAGGGAIAGAGAKPSGASGGGAPYSPNASPLRDNSMGNGGGAVNNVTYVEFNSPFAPSAETGMQIRQHLTAANNSYGRQV